MKVLQKLDRQERLPPQIIVFINLKNVGKGRHVGENPTNPKSMKKITNRVFNQVNNKRVII